MKIPCDIKAPCLDDANPFQNLSSEAPDVNHFFAYGSGPGSILPGRPGGPGGVGPPSGRNWLDTCETENGPITCVGATQEEADLCVQRLGQQCQTGPGTPSGGTLFSNTLQQCAAICPDGSPFVFQVAAGLFVAESQILADREAQSYACRQAQLLKLCLGSLSSPGACVGQSFFSTVSISGGSGFTASISGGSLPPGITMSVSGSTILFAGTPATPGNYSFGVRVTNSRGNFMQKNYTLFVIGFTNGDPPAFTQGIPYSFQFTTSGGLPPITVAVTNGVLPDGLTLSSAGMLSGTPTASVSQTVSLTATDAQGLSCAKQYTLTANAFGFRICNWDGIKALLTLGGCPASALPAWNGAFDLKTSDPVLPGSVIWYFINQSINGLSVAASDTPDYPNGPWQDNDCFAQLFFDPGVPQWNLNFFCSDCSFASFWTGAGSSVDPNDPSGRYNAAAVPPGMKPDVIFVAQRSEPCCNDSGNLVGATYAGVQPARVRIKNYAAFLAALGACPLCDASGSPAWDGTFTVQYAPDNSTLIYVPTGTAGAPLFVLPPLSVAGHKISNGIAVQPSPFLAVYFRPNLFWQVDLICVATGQPGNQSVMWTAAKGVGADATGMYLRNGGAAGTPPCLTIESF